MGKSSPLCLCILTASPRSSSGYTDQLCSPLAACADQMLVFQRDRTTKAGLMTGFCCPERATPGSKFSKFLLNQPHFIPCMASLTFLLCGRLKMIPQRMLWQASISLLKALSLTYCGENRKLDTRNFRLFKVYFYLTVSGRATE